MLKEEKQNFTVCSTREGDNGPIDNTLNESNSVKDVVPDKKNSKKQSLNKYLNFKMMFLYPGIILSAGWTILNIIKIIGYVD